MINHIRHNSPSPIQCLRAIHILFFAYLLFHCYYYNHYKTEKYYFCYRYFLLPLPLLSYYFATKHFAANTKFPGVVELTTQLLILENILWLPLCRINKFGLNTLPSKTVAIPYTCGLSSARLATRLEASRHPDDLTEGGRANHGDNMLLKVPLQFLGGEVHAVTHILVGG